MEDKIIYKDFDLNVKFRSSIVIVPFIIILLINKTGNYSSSIQPIVIIPRIDYDRCVTIGELKTEFKELQVYGY